jgi:hypothetical protein
MAAERIRVDQTIPISGTLEQPTVFVVDRMEMYYVEEFHVKGVAHLATNFCPRLQLLQCCVQSDIP